MVKKIAVSLIMVSLVLAVGSIAAEKKPKPAAPVASAPAPVASSAKNLALGVYNGAPSIAYRFNPQFVGEAGFNYNSSSNNSNGWTLMVRGDYDLGQGTIVPHAGGTVWLVSATANNATTSTYVIGGLWGVTGWLTDSFSVTADLYPLIFQSVTAAGATTTTFDFLNTGVVAARYWF